MSFSKNKLVLLALALMLSVFLAACGGQDEPAPDATDDTGEAPVEATEGGDLTIAIPSDAVSLDPQGSNDSPSSNVQVNIYDSLIYHDENLELQPALATEWELVEDNVWKITLREGVQFHDGSELTAEVVKANFDRVLDPDVASPRSFLFDMINETKVVDDYTVHFVTEFPFSPLPSHLAHSGGGIISLNAIQADYEAMEAGQDAGSYVSANPSGAGPFVFEEWVPGQYIKLVKNDNYWGEPAKIDSVTFSIVPESLTRVAELETGNTHIIEQVQPTDISRIEGTPGIGIDRTESLSSAYIGFNTEKAPFDDIRVRQAVTMALDKEIVVNNILDGVGTIAYGPLAANVFGYSDEIEVLEYDVEAAKALLAEAGHADGFSTTIWTNDNPQRMDLAEFVQAQLKEIGIDVSIEVLEWGAYLENTANAQHDMFILGWVTVTADADYGLYALFHSKNHGSAGNRSFIADPELDALLDQARQEADPDVRAELYKEAQQIIVTEAPVTYTHFTHYVNGVNENVQGFWQHPNGMMQLQNVTITQ
ncbi:glutathione ABC transporter substrate-binding protein [Bacillus sp. FJAT-45350]|uniref:glutathione ABC transporter substrate-binding protein n=1 Tax=Bacillus sp. FJAT-45350 TaxID=2011014 RepID=UPI000BB8D8F4|nr:glutathione ABC transporter substrate-binding protein [Bacillus sp. FJAT-45350]